MKNVLTLCGHEESESQFERSLENAKEITSVELRHYDFWNNDSKTEAINNFFQCCESRRTLNELTVQSCTGPAAPIWTNINFLKRLTLSMVNISVPLHFNSTLEELSLFEVSLSDDVAAALGESLSEPANHLKKLDLTDSRFLANGATLLARGLATNTTLENLCVSECNLMDEQVSDLVCALEYHASIRDLDISFNKCRHSGVNALARLLESNVSQLCKLSMDFQAFGECKSINLSPIFSALSSSSSSSNTSLKYLGLGGNSLRDRQMPSLVDVLCDNQTLEKLDLSENRFTDVGMEALAKRLPEMKGLKQIVLEDNRFGTEGIQFFATALEFNMILEDMEISSTLMRSGGGDDSYSSSWSKIVWYMDLNWGGRRLLRQESPLPRGLWPLVLERVNHYSSNSVNTLEGLSRKPLAEDIIYCLIRGPAIFER